MATSKNFTVRKLHHHNSDDEAVYESINFVATLTDENTIHINDSAGNLLQIQPKKNDGGIDSERTFVKQLIQKYITDGSDENLFNEDEINESAN